MTSARAATEIVIEPEHFIPVTKKLLVNGLLARDDAPEGFLQFCRLIEAVYHFDNLRASQELKEDFRLLEKDEGRIEREHSAENAIEQAETRFLTNFLEAMEKANFRLLSQQDVDFANQEEYLFNLPVQVDWDKLDTQLLGRFLNDRQMTTGTDVPVFAHRILIFRRGVGIDRSHGYHFLPKIDAMVTRCLRWIFGWFLKKPLENGDRPIAESYAGNPTSIHESRRVERISLRNSNVGLVSLFRRTTLQEPTFKELVILFRFAPPSDTEQPADSTIYIKAFRDIPMADLEVVFPEKKISMKPLDLIKLVVTGTIGLVLFVLKIAFVAVLNPVVALAALATVGGYAGKVFFGFKASRDRYQHLVTQSLYHKNLDNDLGVIFYLMDSLEAQEFKEAVLAYYCLATCGASTPAELDGHCERLMLEHFQVAVDFDIDDALQKLHRDRLVELKNDSYRAIPLQEALRRLDEKWDNYFSYNNGDASQAVSAARQGESACKSP